MCCDLLSKCIFDLLIFNSTAPGVKILPVVICFQNVSLIYWYSTFEKWKSIKTELWFAFKMYLWFIDIQHADAFTQGTACCDLLSKCIFDLLIFNWTYVWNRADKVVICFQNVSLIYWYSTRKHGFSTMFRLWFAFKMYLWFIDIQLYEHQIYLVNSCDLLSKCIFDLLIFNKVAFGRVKRNVVICFQNVSLIYWYST